MPPFPKSSCGWRNFATTVRQTRSMWGRSCRSIRFRAICFFMNAGERMATATLNPTAERWQVSRDEYHADRDCLSNSATSVFIDNPALYHGRFITGEYPHESTKATEFGEVFHEIVLEPQRVV